VSRVFLYGRKDGHTDRHDEALRNFANASKRMLIAKIHRHVSIFFLALFDGISTWARTFQYV